MPRVVLGSTSSCATRSRPDDRPRDSAIPAQLGTGPVVRAKTADESPATRRIEPLLRAGAPFYPRAHPCACRRRSGGQGLARGLIDAAPPLLDNEREFAQLAEAQRIARRGSFEQRPGADAKLGSEELYRLLGVAPGTPLTVAVVLEAKRPTSATERGARSVGRSPSTFRSTSDGTETAASQFRRADVDLYRATSERRAARRDE